MNPRPFESNPKAAAYTRDPSSPCWFPVAYDVGAARVELRPVSLQTIGDSSFLDSRMPGDAGQAVRCPASDLEGRPAPPPALLFHTAFCGSTLLARALHAPPGVVALKEPGLLLDVAKADHPSFTQPVGRVGQAAALALALLSQPWTDGGRVLIKPTNQVNRILPRLVALAAPARVLLLYSDLEQFLLSCCKKLPMAETRIRWMAQFLLPGSRLGQTLGVPWDRPFNFVESCVLTWHLQIERYAEVLADDTADRLRTLSLDALLADPVRRVGQAAHWLGLHAALEGLEERVDSVFARHAKRQEQAFGRAERAREDARVRAAYGPLLERALAWAETAIAPYARRPREWKRLGDGSNAPG